MEYEVRYYYPKKDLENILNKLEYVEKLSASERCYEKTSQFDHPCEELSFYDKRIDGRFRIRITKSELLSKCKVSWKRRIPATTKTEINQEEEVELTIQYDEYDNLMFLITNILKMKDIESYERYRTIFFNDEIEIAVDEYPFGIALEIECKSKTGNPKEIIKKWADILEVDINKAYRLSWDDKYTELCRNQNVEIYSHVEFGLPMPEVL